MGLFGTLFGAIEPTGAISGTPSFDGTYAIDVEFTELVQELIDDFIESPNAVWVSRPNDLVPNPNKPFRVKSGNPVKYDVKIIFATDDLEDRQYSRYRKETALVDGQINGFMYAYDGWEPKLKDTVEWKGRALTLNAIDPIQPIDKVLLYFFEFGS